MALTVMASGPSGRKVVSSTPTSVADAIEVTPALGDGTYSIGHLFVAD